MVGKHCIAVVTPFLDKRHGTERCLVEQVERLAFDHGHEVHLYCQRVEGLRGLEEFPKRNKSPLSVGPKRGVESSIRATPAVGRILWHKIPALPGPHLLRYLWWLLANQLQRWRDQRFRGLRYDLVYSPGINCWDADAIVIHIVFREFYRQVREELRLRKIPMRAWPRTFHRHLYYRLIMALEDRIYADPRVTLAAVSGLSAQAVQRFFGRDDVQVIPNAVDRNAFNPAARLKRRGEVRRQRGFDDNDFVLLLVGNDWKKKGLLGLLEAASRCSDLPLRLLVVGGDDCGPYREDIQRLGLRGRVQFEAPSEDVVQFYSAADAYVGPSLEDAFGLPPLEAMACGLPVIVSGRAGVSQLIHSGHDGLILQDPRNVSELAEMIRQLCVDADLRRQIAANAVATAHQYGWERNAEQTLALLGTALSRRWARASR